MIGSEVIEFIRRKKIDEVRKFINEKMQKNFGLVDGRNSFLSHSVRNFAIYKLFLSEGFIFGPHDSEFFSEQIEEINLNQRRFIDAENLEHYKPCESAHVPKLISMSKRAIGIARPILGDSKDIHSNRFDLRA